MGSKKSKSSSSSNVTTTNVDRRQVVAEGAIGIASDSSTINLQMLDADIVNKALEVVGANDATNGASFTQLLSLADKMFTGAGDIISKAQDTTLSQIGALQTAQNDQKGAIDQKTLVIVAGTALGFMALRKK